MKVDCPISILHLQSYSSKRIQGPSLNLHAFDRLTCLTASKLYFSNISAKRPCTLPCLIFPIILFNIIIIIIIITFFRVRLDCKITKHHHPNPCTIRQHEGAQHRWRPTPLLSFRRQLQPTAIAQHVRTQVRGNLEVQPNMVDFLGATYLHNPR